MGSGREDGRKRTEREGLNTGTSVGRTSMGTGSERREASESCWGQMCHPKSGEVTGSVAMAHTYV